MNLLIYIPELINLIPPELWLEVNDILKYSFKKRIDSCQFGKENSYNRSGKIGIPMKFTHGNILKCFHSSESFTICWKIVYDASNNLKYFDITITQSFSRCKSKRGICYIYK